MKREHVTRRQILKTGGKVTTGFAVLASGAVNLTAFSAWAANKKSLDAHVAKTLLLISRDLFPHNNLDDDYYMLAVDSLDGKAAGDDGVKKMLSDGVAAADKAAGGTYVDASGKKRTKILKSMEGESFFGTMRWEMVSVFYNNKKVWDKFGYEGPSYEHGGYYARGFQDADWPQPSSDASPKGWWE